ncbi:MAG: tetraacyldisaccharide 4'-kinase, partial [Bacteroidota bacterium]|nr:tetraacyldisaccharide 4'-kinase [Bacteroidota bacterium]
MRLLLYALSIIYGIIISLRNSLFDYGILKTKTHNLPIICIGNLSVGGSGKTPHTNYIAKLLAPNYKVAILSRGYGRKSSEFNYVELDSAVSAVGDEPLQLKLNNPNCIVAVNNNKNKGVKKILIDHPGTNVILLDDGFQHRRIKAGLNIIVTPFDKPFIKDNLLPLGTLREPASAATRADIILVSKTPKDITPTEKKGIIENLHLKAHQKGYFSSITYYKYKCIKNNIELENKQDYSITLVSGIANPTPLVNYLKKQGRKVNLIQFADHHNYTSKDIENILLEHNKNKDIKKLILTTEKDATKLRELLSDFKGEPVYYTPIDMIVN